MSRRIVPVRWPLLLFGLLIAGVLQVSSYINQPGAEPKFSFLQEPPEHAIVSKKFPAVLQCSEKLSDSVQDDLRYSFDGHRVADGDLEDVIDDAAVENGEEDDDEDGEEAELPEAKESEEYDTPHLDTLPQPKTSALMNKRKQSTFFSALKAEDDPASPPAHPLRFGANDMELFRDAPPRISSRRPPGPPFRHQRRRRRKRRRRRHLTTRPTFEYTWTKNGEPLPSEGTELFEVAKDGTLRVAYSEQAPGIYRCVINGTRWGFGAIISRDSNVTLAEFTRSNVSTNVTAEIGNPLVLNCPIYSAPAANVTWFFNDTPIDYVSANRYFQMANGSLLISKMTGFDDGKFKCVAVNNFVPKSQRVFKPQVNVVPQQNMAAVQRMAGRLMGPFQDTRIQLRERSSLHLLCAAYHGLGHSDLAATEVRWSFTPRASAIPIELEGTRNELKFSQVVHVQHDGVYNCSTSTDYQTFDVSIAVPPKITKKLVSIATTMGAKIRMECAATGAPPPDIVWYRNGQRIVSNSVTTVEGELLRIHSVDPTDEGMYQCMAGNALGQAFTTAYLTVRKAALQGTLPRLYGIKCYPIDYRSILVTFRSTMPVDMITHYLKADNPLALEVVPPVRTSEKFVISGQMDPLRNYTLILRGLTKAAVDPLQMGKKQESMLIMSRLSKGTQCATQGLEVLSTAFPDHVFIWWPLSSGMGQRRSNYTLALDHFLVQLWNNDTLRDHSPFAAEVIGTTGVLDEYMTWQEIEKMLVKIPGEQQFINSSYVVGNPETFSRSSSAAGVRRKSLRQPTRTHVNVTVIRVPGNVTGVLIPKTKRVLARVLGVRAGEVIEDEEMKYVQWKRVENSVNGVSKLRIVSTNSKNVQLAWNAFGVERSACLMLCYKNTNAEFLMFGSLPDCKTINANKSSVVLKPLPANTLYKMHLRTCTSAEPITDIIEVLTRPDVPGKVTNPRIRIDDGVVLSWDAPAKQPGVTVQFYSVEWEVHAGGDKGTVNLTAEEFSLKLPAVSPDDKFSASIRAIGNTGIGSPHFFNRANLPTQHRSKYADTILAVAMGSVICVLLIFICGTIIYCHRRRAKARRRLQQMARQMHEQQQFRGNQQMMNGLDYSGLSTGGGGGGGEGDSYRFDAMPSVDERGTGNGVDAHDGLTTVLPTATDPLTFMQPSIVREEILAGSVPTIIHRHHPLVPANEEPGDMHEMQTLISRGGLRSRHGAPDTTILSSGRSEEETVSVPSGIRDASSEDSEADVGSSNNSNNGPITSTPTKSANGYVVMRPNGIEGAAAAERRHPTNGTTTRAPVQLPIVNLYRPQSPHCPHNNNNPKHVNKNSAALGLANGQPPKVMMNGGLPAVYTAVSRKGAPPQTWDFHNSGGSMRRSNGGATAVPELDHLIRRRRDEDLVHENGYEEEDDSRTGLLGNGSGVSGGSLEESGGSGEAAEKTNGHHLASNALWDTFRRPIVGPNG